MTEQLSLQEFAQKIRERRPDLADIPDVTLVAKTLAAAPELKQYVDIGNLPGMNAVAKTVPDDRSAGMVASDQAANVLKGIPQAVTGIPSVVGALIKAGLEGNPLERQRQLGELAAGAAQPVTTIVKGATSGQSVPIPSGMNVRRVQMPEYPEGNPANPAWAQAAQGAGAALGAAELPNVVGGAAGVVDRVIPNSARAGANLQRIENVVGQQPVNHAAADAIAARAQQLGTRGSALPKVASDFIAERAQGPMTYAASRDYATSAGRLSAAERMAANRPMKAQIAKFAEALDSANRDVAASAGLGDLYDAAIKEYRQASSIADKAAIVKKWGVPAALTLANLGMGANLIRKLIEK